ncbi:hypothetical protein DMA11_21600 [Marinilabiliaceae bacterium JC017]|nr:hypothetical protein DMA11_21600 [Marinilabiliaceae bacterium JC017]
MIEDPALTLKKAYDRGELIDIDKANGLLHKSDLVNRLLVEPKQRPELFVGIRAYEWRLIELSEIPFSGSIKKVQDWINLLINKTYTPEGFSLTGNRNGILACHNAMITTLLLKIGYNNKDKIEAGINWIINYQSTERGTECSWTGSDLNSRFGGCMKKTPCFYGVVKSMISLTEYKKRFDSSYEIDTKLKQGLEYILKHNVFQKLSTGQPIENSIIKNFYPYSYKSNLLEILTLLKHNNLYNDSRCKEAIEILKQKRHEDRFWRSEVSQMKSTWIDFDPLNKPGLWISYMIRKLLNE